MLRATPTLGSVPAPPPLPRHLLDIRTVIVAGSAAWLLGAAALLLARLLAGRPLDLWFATCVAGVALGALGAGIVSWQRAAERRGSRPAQTDLD